MPVEHKSHNFNDAYLSIPTVSVNQRSTCMWSEHNIMLNAVTLSPMHTQHSHSSTITCVCKGCWHALRRWQIPDSLLNGQVKPLMWQPTKPRSHDALGFKKTPHVPKVWPSPLMPSAIKVRHEITICLQVLIEIHCRISYLVLRRSAIIVLYGPKF